MKKAIFALLLLSGTAMNTFSQKVNIVKFSPQHLAVNTFNLTWERASSSGSRTSLNISPFITFYDRLNYRNTKEKVAGAGIELGKKLYVSRVDSSSALKGFYASGSLSYGFYSADYQKDDDSSYINNSSYYGSYTAYTTSGRTYHEDIHRIGADVFIGYQFPVKKVFYIDAFLGAGMRYGISSKGDDSYYKYSLLDLGHSGIIPKAGIKIGLKI
jgi:hypothetical protein